LLKPLGDTPNLIHPRDLVIIMPSTHTLVPTHAFSPSRCRALIAGCVALVLSSAAIVVDAQTVAPAVSAPVAAPVPAPAKKVVGLLAAVGDKFQYVRQKQGTGSNMDPYTRQIVTVPNQGLNKMILRGMDRTVEGQYPGADIVMMMLQPDPSWVEVTPQDAETHTMSRVLDLLRTYPARDTWEEILVVTPKWLRTDREGMGTKLSGIGLYVQPLESNRDAIVGTEGILDDEIRDLGSNKKPRSSTYVAPFFYTQITVLDAKTLAVKRTEARYDFRKMINSDSTAVDIAKSFTSEQLGAEIEKFVEASARRLVVDKPGTIDIGPVKTLPDKK
jgi:hypothetical protein